MRERKNEILYNERELEQRYGCKYQKHQGNEKKKKIENEMMEVNTMILLPLNGLFSESVS